MEGILMYVFSPSCTIGLKLKLVFKPSKYIVAISRTLSSIELVNTFLEFA